MLPKAGLLVTGKMVRRAAADTEPRVVAEPTDVTRALDATLSPALPATPLSCSRKREHVLATESAKTETRVRRIEAPRGILPYPGTSRGSCGRRPALSNGVAPWRVMTRMIRRSWCTAAIRCVGCGAVVLRRPAHSVAASHANPSRLVRGPASLPIMSPRPQRTLYVSAPVLRDIANELIILGATGNRPSSGLVRSHLGHT